jgi:lysophospholipase
LLLYTGGTIGMKTSPKGYVPVQDFLGSQLAQLSQFHSKKYARKYYAEHCENVDYEQVPLHYTKDSVQGPSVLTVKEDRSTNETDSKESRLDTSQKSNESFKKKKKQKSLPEWFFTPKSKQGARAMFKILEYNPLMDSSNMSYKDWVKIAADIKSNYNYYDAFIVLHGTDTMAYTTSALSFMLENLRKTIIVTGSQIPISQTRNDGFDNLLGSLTIAMNYEIPEVCLFFNNRLFRGNRAIKNSCSDLDAFQSMNCPALVQMGINIDVNWNLIRPRPHKREDLIVSPITNPNVGCLRIFPGITDQVMANFFRPPMKGVILLTYGSGNAPDIRPDFLRVLKEANDNGVVIVNVTQCQKGMVSIDYAGGTALREVGVISGCDMTCEAAITKLMYLLSKNLPIDEVKRLMTVNLRGELTVIHDRTRFSLKEKVLVKQVAHALMRPDEEDIDAIKDALFPTILCSLASIGELDEIIRLVEVEGVVLDKIQDYDMRTPLHLAVSSGNKNIVEYLVKNGSNVNARDRWGHTPLSEARANNNEDIVRILLQYGAVDGESGTDEQKGEKRNNLAMENSQDNEPISKRIKNH